MDISSMTSEKWYWNASDEKDDEGHIAAQIVTLWDAKIGKPMHVELAVHIIALHNESLGEISHDFS